MDLGNYQQESRRATLISLQYRMKQLILFGLLLSLLFFVNTPVTLGKKQLSISPPTLKLSLAAGTTVPGVVTVYNDGTEDLPYIFLYPVNFRVGEKGEKRFVSPSKGESILRSPASWISFPPAKSLKSYDGKPYVSLKPGRRQDIEFKITVPERAGPGDHTALIFSEMRIAPPKQGVALKLIGRVGCRISLRIAGDIIEKLTVSSPKVKSVVIGNKFPYSFRIRNEGNIDHSGKVVMDILDQDGKKAKSIDIDKKAYYYADTPREYASVANVNNLGFGRHRARLVLNYISPEGSKRIEKETTFFAIPNWVFWVLVGGIVILILMFSYLLDRVFRRKKKRYQPRHRKR